MLSSEQGLYFGGTAKVAYSLKSYISLKGKIIRSPKANPKSILWVFNPTLQEDQGRLEGALVWMHFVKSNGGTVHLYKDLLE